MKDEKNLMIRLKTKSKAYLQELAVQRNESMTKVVEDLLEDHRRRSFFEGLASEYAALKQDSQAWKEELEEQALLDTASADGLADE